MLHIAYRVLHICTPVGAHSRALQPRVLVEPGAAQRRLLLCQVGRQLSAALLGLAASLLLLRASGGRRGV